VTVATCVLGFLVLALLAKIRGGGKMDERNPREDEPMEDRTNDEDLVDKSDEAEEFEDIEESDDEDVEE
jgi:hypothetical protein